MWVRKLICNLKINMLASYGSYGGIMKNDSKKYLMSVVVLFAFIWLYEWFVHSQVLASIYLQTKGVWRPQHEMQELGYYFLVVYLLYAVIFTTLFKRYVNSKNLSDSGRFGFLVGAIIGSWSFGSYVFLPISLGLAACWFLANTVAGAIAGVLLGLINSKK